MATDASFDSRLKNIDKAIGRYYRSKGKGDDYFNDEGIGKFYEFVQINGFAEDEEGFNEEVHDNTAEDSLLVDFDEDFPTPDNVADNKTSEFIFNLIQKCVADPDIKTFDVNNNDDEKFPDIFEKLQNFEIADNNLQTRKKLHLQQCPKEFIKTLISDEITFKFMAIGGNYGFEYVQHLVDQYFRWQIASFKQNKIKKIQLDIATWAFNNNPHFAELKAKKGKVFMTEVKQAVAGFSGRIGNRVILPPAHVINDSLEQVSHRIRDAVLFVHKIKKENCPFQVDICFAFGQMKSAMNDDEKNEQDDDDDDITENIPLVAIGNIEAKLKNNKLQYAVQEFKTDKHEVARFDVMYNTKFSKKLGTLKNQRFITLIDRRNENENVFMYAPPKDSSCVPNNAVSVVYFSNSAVCLVPCMDYKEAPKWDGKKAKDVAVSGHKNQKIGSKTHCAMMTLSFHVKEEDVVKCYLFVNGQYVRFMPDDLRDILPEFFVKDKKNVDFVTQNIEDHEKSPIEKLINDIKPCLKDKNFEAFVEAYFKENKK